MMDAREKEIYFLYSKLSAYKRKVDQSMQIIEDALETMKKPYISMSFGKDSLVMSHLILSQYKMPMVYVNCGKYDEWPDTSRVKEDFLKLFPEINFMELPGPSIMEYYRQVGGIYIQDEEDNHEARMKQRQYAASLGKIIDAEARKRGYDGAFIGMRAKESDIRSFLFAKRGCFYFAETRQQWTCCPLYRWTGRDIWAYIVNNNLPYNELYDLAPEGREMARNGAMFGTRSARYGRLVFLKRMYPDWFNQFAAEFPEIRSYT